MNCKNCKAHCALVGKERDVNYKCLAGYVPITNADRIRAMSDEELAENVIVVRATTDYCQGVCKKGMNCYKCRLEWLKKEVDDEHTD